MKKLLISFFLTTSLFVITAAAQTVLPISGVQGDGHFSPYAGKEVTVEGVVTAVRKRGVFIQTPDEKIDDDPDTSEGIYVFTSDEPAPEITPGTLLEVKGTVSEFRAKNETYSLFLTEIINPAITIISLENPLPTATELTQEYLSPKGQIDQLERFEGMRVKISELIVVAPTGGYFNAKEDKVVSDGIFYGVLAGTKRPFREPGIDALKVLIDKLPETLSIFDMNPELIRVDSKALDGKILDVTSGASIKNITGIIDYNSAAYTLFIDPREVVTVENIRTFLPASPAGKNEVTVASYNLQNFFDDEDNSELGQKESKVSSNQFEKRLKKASLAIREVVSFPDVLGIIEVENLAVLKKLADRINSDAIATGEEDPKYEAVLLESNDLRGIDVGYLVKTAKVRIVNFEQLAKDTKLDHPQAEAEETLFSRPPILAEFEVPNEDPEKAFKFTVIVNHLKSYRGIEENRVQEKKRMQAEFLAKFVSQREAANPLEKLILIGDFNSFQFNDGYNDLIGTLKGKPNQNVISPSQFPYETGLIDLVEYISPENRYSYVYDGSAQVLDHVLINRPTRAVAKKFGYARLNADFPRIYENDETRPESLSDHDVPVLYLSIGSTESKSDSGKATEVEDKGSIETSLFYSFDDKNVDESEISIEDWKGLKARGAEEGTLNSDIFSHHAGGPNGAEWNPWGDLYLMIRSKAVDGADFPTVSINGVPILDPEMKEIVWKESGTSYYWLRLPSEIWMKNLREIREGDLAGIYGQELVDRVARSETETAAPLNTGKIIEFEIRHGDRILKKYFHAAFGE